MGSDCSSPVPPGAGRQWPAGRKTVCSAATSRRVSDPPSGARLRVRRSLPASDRQAAAPGRAGTASVAPRVPIPGRPRPEVRWRALRSEMRCAADPPAPGRTSGPTYRPSPPCRRASALAALRTRRYRQGRTQQRLASSAGYSGSVGGAVRSSLFRLSTAECDLPTSLPPCKCGMRAPALGVLCEEDGKPAYEDAGRIMGQDLGRALPNGARPWLFDTG